MPYGDEIKQGNIVENWLFDFENDNSGYIRLSFSDAIDSSNFYHGVILNKPSIRESIDLAESTAKSSNLSISIPDFSYQGSPISEELFGGSNHYINQTVSVWSKVGAGDKQQIGSFRLTDISSNGDTLSLSLTTHRPWDFISFPQDQTITGDYYVPYVVGDFTENDSYYNSPAFCDVKLFPVPSIGADEEVIRTIMPRSYSSSDGSQINIWHGSNVFLPLQSSTGNKTEATTTIQNVDAMETGTNRLANGWVYANESRNPHGTGTELDNTHLAFDKDDSTSASVSVVDTSNYLLGFTTVPEKWSTHSIRKIEIKHSYSVDGDFNVYIYDGSSLNSSGSVEFTAGVDLTTTINVSGTVKVGSQWTIIYVRTDGGNGDLSVDYVKVNIHTAFSVGHSNQDEKDELMRLGEVETFYCGGDGLTKSYAGGGNIEKIHEAHRDLIIRFAGVSTDEPEGWSSLDSDKDWEIRWWQLEPTELKKALEKLQYEGGFIFRFKADGSPQYIHIPDTQTVSNTFTKSDISNVTVRPSSFSDLLTKMDVNYERHPAENRYLTSVSSSNSTSRTNWNIQTKENIKKVDLDAYVSPEIPTTPSTNPNDDFYTYYSNVFSDIKMLVSCTIVNPKYYDVEVGDIVAFDDMHPETPFGYNSATWSGLKFMITSLNRTLGELKIEAREI